MTVEARLLSKVAHINARITDKEKVELFHLARAVPAGGRILEIGACYGASTAVLCLGAPGALIVTVDKFVHHPAGQASPELLKENLDKAGVLNWRLVQRDSLSLRWGISPIRNMAIDLLWIDGAHDYPHVRHDLFEFGPHAQVIAMHDYEARQNGVKQAADEFIERYPEWHKTRKVGRIAILERKSDVLPE